MSVSRSAAAKHLLKLQDAESSFEGFVKIVEPTFELADFQLDLIRKLDLLEKGELVDDEGRPAGLLVTMPPRHAKSTFSTVLFPAYFAEEPNTLHTVLLIQHNAGL